MDVERVGLTSQPVRDRTGVVLALDAPGQLDEGGDVLRAYRLLVDGGFVPAALELPQPLGPGHDVVELPCGAQGFLLRRVAHPLHEVAADRAVHGLVTLRVAPAEVAVEGVADDVVGAHTEGPRLHARQLPEPGEEFGGVLVGERHAQQLLGGVGDMAAHLQGPAVGGCGRSADHMGQQAVDDRAQRRPKRLVRRGVVVGRGLRDQAQGERMARGEPEKGRVQCGVGAPRGEQRGRVGGPQLPYRYDLEDLAPRQVRLPERVRCVPSGDDDQGARR